MGPASRYRIICITMQVVQEMMSNMKSREDDLLSAVLPLLKLLSLTLIGLLLAHQKHKSFRRRLSSYSASLYLPFSYPALSSFTWVNPLHSRTPPPEFTRFTIIMTAFGNTGNLPLAIVGSVCHSKDNFFGPDCHRKGVAYVSFAQWVAVILVYTLVYHMMEPPLEYYEVVEEEGIEIKEKQQGDNVSKPLLVEAEWPGIEDKENEHSKTPFIAKIFKSISNASQTTIPDIDHSADGNSPESIRCLAEPRVFRKIRIIAEQTPLQHILQPPIIASLLAIIVGMVPQIKAFVFGYDAPLSFVTDSLEILGGAMVPSVMLILGGMLAEGPNESNLGFRTTIGVIVARQLMLPLLGIGIVALADKLQFLVHGDQMYRFVLLLQYTTPSAILLGAIASLRGYAASESSALLFWQHLVALLSLSLYVFIYFKLL
ncbi:unnamed protein product [Ilex paraguariensis]|uniref:Auxin efflux carrier family protein n=1 Tax=Ilex paraguariensis TaxID=185542 RepID=A0ABC8SJ27_9AQUA